MSYFWYNSLNETLKQIDLGIKGWVFVFNGGTTDDYSDIEDDLKMDWIAVRRHCGGLLILRKTYPAESVMAIEEIPISSAKAWLKLNMSGSVAGFPELNT